MTLDPIANRFSFQVFDDSKERRYPWLARIFHGALADHVGDLASLNAHGAGVFVCINATDLRGRGHRHIKRVRAIWQDDDHGWRGAFPLPASLVVRTSPGRFQRLWLCDGLTIDQHRAVQERLAVSFGHDPQACGVNRVLRLPGFRHMKNPDATAHRPDSSMAIASDTRPQKFSPPSRRSNGRRLVIGVRIPMRRSGSATP